MLRAERITSALDSSFWNIEAYDKTQSTNTLIKEKLRNNCPEGVVATALIQEGGYGRQGRLWSSPLGGLYFSFALRPFAHDQGLDQKTIPTLSLVVALSLYRVLTDLGISCAQIKWPNDVLVDQKKVCGISLEGVAGGICVGVGINVFPHAGQSALSQSYETGYVGSLLVGQGTYSGEEGKQDLGFDSSVHHDSGANVTGSASSFSSRSAAQGNQDADLPALYEKKSNGTQPFMANLSPFRQAVLENLLASFLNAFDYNYKTWLDQGFSAFLDEYNSLLFNVGEYVTLESVTNTTLFSGVVKGINKEGFLLLKQPDGQIIATSSGEVHTRHK